MSVVFKSMKVRWVMPCGAHLLRARLTGLAVCALAATAPAVWAQTAPVLAGAWDVRSLTTFEPRSTVPVARRYRICIGPDRARAPMQARNPAPSTELVFTSLGYNGYAARVTATDGTQRQLDFSYRRLSARAFEGTHELAGSGRISRLQYDAQYVGPDCGATRPSWPRDSGEP